MGRHLQRIHPKSYMEWRRHRRRTKKRSELSNVELTNLGNKRSSIWIFFDNKNNTAVCKICGISMKHNMARHLYNKHPKAHKKWQNIRRKNSDFIRLSKDNPAKFVNTRRGWIKQYMKKIGINLYRCELCFKNLKMPTGDYGNMKRHIRYIHPYVYDQENKEYRNAKRAESEESTEDVLDVEHIDSNDPHLSSDHSITEKPQNEELKDDEVKTSSCRSKRKAKANKKVKEPKHTDNSDDAQILELNEILRENDPLIEDKIKRICTKGVAAKRYKSKTCFWNFFEVLIDGHLYKCRFCEKELSIYPKSVGNLKRHVATQHTWQYNLILKYAPKYDTCKSSKPLYTELKQPAVIKYTSATDFDVLDRGCFKCKVCDKVIVCGDDEKILFDHVREEHASRVVNCSSQDLRNADDNQFEVIIEGEQDITSVKQT